MELNEQEICATFDQRVEQGVVIFNGYRTVVHSEQDFKIEFRILSGLTHKPVTPGTQPTTPSPSSSSGTQGESTTTINTGLRPGSDINISGYELSPLPPHHLLAFNKFSASRPHLLILTEDGHRRQHEALDAADIGALRQVLASLCQTGGGKRYLGIYNCGVESGCSRLHKHMQVFPAPEETEDQGFGLWPDFLDAEQGLGRLPMRCFVRRFDEGGEFPGEEEILGAYKGLLREAGEALERAGGGGGMGEGIPHNVILDRRWIVVVPRRYAGLNGLIPNAAAVLGMVWVPNEKHLEAWIGEGVSRVLAHVGISQGTV